MKITLDFFKKFHADITDILKKYVKNIAGVKIYFLEDLYPVLVVDSPELNLDLIEQGIKHLCNQKGYIFELNVYNLERVKIIEDDLKPPVKPIIFSEIIQLDAKTSLINNPEIPKVATIELKTDDIKIEEMKASERKAKRIDEKESSKILGKGYLVGQYRTNAGLIHEELVMFSNRSSNYLVAVTLMLVDHFVFLEVHKVLPMITHQLLGLIDAYLNVKPKKFYNENANSLVEAVEVFPGEFNDLLEKPYFYIYAKLPLQHGYIRTGSSARAMKEVVNQLEKMCVLHLPVESKNCLIKRKSNINRLEFDFNRELFKEDRYLSHLIFDNLIKHCQLKLSAANQNEFKGALVLGRPKMQIVSAHETPIIQFNKKQNNNKKLKKELKGKFFLNYDIKQKKCIIRFKHKKLINSKDVIKTILRITLKDIENLYELFKLRAPFLSEIELSFGFKLLSDDLQSSVLTKFMTLISVNPHIKKLILKEMPNNCDLLFNVFIEFTKIFNRVEFDRNKFMASLENETSKDISQDNDLISAMIRNKKIKDDNKKMINENPKEFDRNLLGIWNYKDDKSQNTTMVTPSSAGVLSASSSLVNTLTSLIPWPTRSLFVAVFTNFQFLRQKTLEKMVKNPSAYKLKEDGVSHLIIKGSIKNKGEEKLIKLISQIRAKQYVDEVDSEYGNSALHWCAQFNYSELGFVLQKAGFDNEKQNKLRLTPTLLAAAAGKQTYVLDRLRNKVGFSTAEININLSLNIKWVVNELHLSIIRRDARLVEEIFKVFEEKNMAIDWYMSNVGNLLHLLVYVALVEKVNIALFKQKNISPETPSTLNLLEFLINRYADNKLLRQLLLDKEGNYDKYTPLELAAKYGLIGLVQVFMKYLKLLNLASGRDQIINAFYSAAEHGQDELLNLFFDYYQFKTGGLLYDKVMQKLANNPQLKTTYVILRDHVEDQSINTATKPDFKVQPYENLVLSGGGGKGVAYPYVLKAFKDVCEVRTQVKKQEDLSFSNIVRVVGTSEGAIFAMGVAVGFTSEQMIEELDYDFGSFLESKEIEKIVAKIDQKEAKLITTLDIILQQLNVKCRTLLEVGSGKRSTVSMIWHRVTLYDEFMDYSKKLQELFKEFKGFSQSNTAFNFLRQLLVKQGIPTPENFTFGDLAELVRQDIPKPLLKRKGYKHLYVVVTNVNTGVPVLLSSENPIYAKYTILDAVRASMSFPIIFCPHHLKKIENGKLLTLPDEYIDGGVVRNYAIDEFDFRKYSDPASLEDPDYPEFNKKTISFKFNVKEERSEEKSSVDSKSINKMNTVMDRLQSIIAVFANAEQLISEYINDEYDRSIKLNTDKVTTFTFKKLSTMEKAALKKCSEEAVEKFTGVAKKVVMPATVTATTTTSGVGSLVTLFPAVNNNVKTGDLAKSNLGGTKMDSKHSPAPELLLLP